MGRREIVPLDRQRPKGRFCDHKFCFSESHFFQSNSSLYKRSLSNCQKPQYYSTIGETKSQTVM